VREHRREEGNQVPFEAVCAELHSRVWRLSKARTRSAENQCKLLTIAEHANSQVKGLFFAFLRSASRAETDCNP